MPARTRLIKQALATLLIVFLGFIIALNINDSKSPSYKLSNSADVSAGGIATNSRLVGVQLPDIELPSVTGEKVPTRSLLGTPMIINFWYSTCEPCRRELPVLANAASRYLDQVQFVGINIKDSATVAKRFADEYGVEFELLLDINGRLISELGIATAPVTLAVNPNGKIIGQVAGEISATKLDELVKALLK